MFKSFIILPLKCWILIFFNLALKNFTELLVGKGCFHILPTKVKNCERSEILPVRLPQFHMYWLKTWYSWDRGLYNSRHNKKHEYHVCVSYSCLPSPMGVTQRGLDECSTHNKFVSQMRNYGTFSLGIHKSYKKAASRPAQTLPRGRHYLYYPGQETYLLSGLEGDLISIFKVYLF